MSLLPIPIWKEAPFIRLVIPLIAGIVAEYFFSISPFLCWLLLWCCLSAIILFAYLKLTIRFRFILLYGVCINILFVCIGALLTHFNNTSDRLRLVRELCNSPAVMIVSVKEPAAVKPKSYKVQCAITKIQNGRSCTDPGTNIIAYFRKDSTASPPQYGDRIAFIKPLEKIKNIPGANKFDYVKYCAQRNIYFQVFLNAHEYIRLHGTDSNPMIAVLISIQHWVIATLQTFIPGKIECGLAEALLIGYKDDLDKQLVQSYSNTGVVHVIAISGLHLGLVYGLLRHIFLPLGKTKSGKWASPVFILTGLWLFSLLTGASPSVLRSAVMFSFIICGEAISRRTSVFNNLAASSFFLLCYNPYWLWDIGFQLSYTALIGIVVFMKPIYHLFTFKNKLPDAIWKLNAVTLAAQVLTAPVCIYYFHQFPMLFILTNFIAVPLSSLILMGEIALCALSFIKVIAGPVGWLLFWLLKIMNDSVGMLGGLGFSTATGLDINFWQVIFLYVFICSTGAWLIAKQRQALPLALFAAILFMAVRLI